MFGCRISSFLALFLVFFAPLAHANDRVYGMLQNGCTEGFLHKVFGRDAASPDTLDMNSEYVAAGLFNVECGFLGLIQFFIDISATVALFMFVYGGIQYFFELRHPGSKPGSAASKIFYRAAMGLLLMAMAHVIMSLVIAAFTDF